MSGQLPLLGASTISVNNAKGRAQRVAVGLASRDYDKAFDEYRAMPTDETKAAYIDTLLLVLNGRMQDTWPIMYDALRIAKEYRYQEDDPGFEEYIKKKLGMNLRTWRDLEQTYQYARRVDPELFTQPFNTAKRNAEKPGDMDEREIGIGKPGPGRGNKTVDNRQPFYSETGGTSAAYLTARIARDRPDILAKMKAGEYKSVRKAAIDAGIIDPEKSKRFQVPTDPEAAGAYLAKHVDEEWLDCMISAFSEAHHDRCPD